MLWRCIRIAPLRRPQHMSRDVRKPDFCICENKDADQLRGGNREADQRLCFRYLDKENPSLVSSGDREIPTRGSTVSVGNEASPSFPMERCTRGLGFPGSTVHQ